MTLLVIGCRAAPKIAQGALPVVASCWAFASSSGIGWRGSQSGRSERGG